LSFPEGGAVDQGSNELVEDDWKGSGLISLEDELPLAILETIFG